ncbi:MAG TPA: sulfite exporter TauE/SafE family protein [Gemmatimonadales bacterium]|nr:sulfite exporter TauE/SafE family protein [Gemmatimonadales bacterium]
MTPLSLNTTEFTVLVSVGSLLAGLLGSLTGLGGGVVIVPMLTLLFGVDFRYAVGASLVSVIATSSGAAAAYVREGYTNIRIGMFLEVATTIGAVAGAALAGLIPTSVLAVVLGVVLIYSAFLAGRRDEEHVVVTPDPLARRLGLDGSYPTPDGDREYHVQHVRTGFGVMLGAGVLSGLLGIGSGAVKVLAMDQAMCLPFKVSTTTSNFMIGVTAAASAGIYLARGYVEPGIAMPVMLGVLAGSAIGVRILSRSAPGPLRALFAAVIGVLAIEMILSGLRGRV